MFNGRAWYLTTLAIRTDEEKGTDNHWKYMGHDAFNKLSNGKSVKAGNMLYGENTISSIPPSNSV